MGAENYFNETVNSVKNQITGEYDQIPLVADAYRKVGVSSIIIGDENYGEGSSREHAAMEPRHMGCRAVIVRSFARIHETNLKKQGVLPLFFADPADYDKVKGDDVVDVINIGSVLEGGSPTIVLNHADGSVDRIETTNTLSADQFQWFVAGSALNQIRAEAAAGA